MKTSNRDYSFLTERLDPIIAKFPILPRGGPLSVFVVQLRRPDYWILFTGSFTETQIELLFDGNWQNAVDHFSKRPDPFPSPKAIRGGLEAPKNSSFFDIVQSVLRDTILGFPGALMSGDTRLSIYGDGIFVFKNPGFLDKSRRFYFETFLDHEKDSENIEVYPFEKATRERKAYYCRYLIPSEANDVGPDFKETIRRALGDDSYISTNPTHRRLFSHDNIPLILFGNGILVADERHQSKALEAMNSFLAFSFLRGFGCAPASIQEVGSIQINTDGKPEIWSQLPSPARPLRIPNGPISVTALDILINDFGKILDSELSLELRLLHLAYFHLNAGEFLQSFTLAWIVIERRITKLWRDKLSEKGYSTQRLDQLCEPDRFTMSVKIDMLEVSSMIEPDQAEKLSSIRKSRNKASHEGRIPTSDATVDCLSLARHFVKLSLTVEI